MRLGKTQVEFDNGYYVMDIFDVLDANRKIDASNWLMQINVQGVASMGEEDGRKFINTLKREAGMLTKSTPKFDEAGFEALKMRLKLGI